MTPDTRSKTAGADTVQIPRKTLDAVREALKPFAKFGETKGCWHVMFDDLQKAAAALALIDKELGNG